MRLCRQPCSSTPITLTPSRRCGSSMRTRRPSFITAVYAVCQDTPRWFATRATLKWSTTSSVSAHLNAPRESFDLGSTARVMSCRQSRPQPEQRQRRTRTIRTVGLMPNGSCARERTTVPRGTPSAPQRMHQPSVSMTRHSNTARSGSTRNRSATRPSSSRRQKTDRSAGPKAALSTSRSSEQ